MSLRKPGCCPASLNSRSCATISPSSASALTASKRACTDCAGSWRTRLHHDASAPVAYHLGHHPLPPGYPVTTATPVLVAKGGLSAFSFAHGTGGSSQRV